MTVFCADDKHVRACGRNIFENGIRYLSYTNSFIEFEFTGTYAEAEIISDLTPSEEIFRAYAAIFAGDMKTPVKRIKIDEKKAVYELFSSDSPTRIKIRLMKVSEAAFAKMGVSEIRIEGELHEPPKPETERRIEFVGDSITCGYGIDGIWNRDTFSTETENPLKGFAYKTAVKCGAEFQYVSWSGMGVYSSWVDENAEKPLDNWLMTDIYPYTDSGLENTLGREGHENHERWDFSRFVPQVIVFGIGTNDHSWTKDIPERQRTFEEKYYDMLEFMREKNPEAYIICVYGVMEDKLTNEEERAVERFKREHDGRICYIHLPEQDEADGIGADWHPSEKTHEKMSDIISAKIKEIFGEAGI
ncbi:MAG: GDSL-type esterase/lipase family protein [Ruminococcus sp.]|nr:GDSL-type esterase/lipase family protein [Ruminococcus sp.]